MVREDVSPPPLGFRSIVDIHSIVKCTDPAHIASVEIDCCIRARLFDFRVRENVEFRGLFRLALT